MAGHHQGPQRLDGRIVIITGGSAGIGAEAARQFADRGARLVLVARGREALDHLVEQLSFRTEVIAVSADVSDVAAAKSMLQRAHAHYGAIHVLVNNAAANYRGPVETRAVDELATIVDVNLRAPIALSRMVLPYLREAGGGSIVNVASLAGRAPVPGGATYSATKFGLRAFSFALAEELRGSGIAISVVSPGPVETGFLMSDIDNVPNLVFSQPMSTAEDIAAAIVECAMDGKRERALPRVSGFLATLGYLAPQLKRVLDPLLERRGRKAKERYREKYNPTR